MAKISVFVNPEQVGRILLLGFRATRIAAKLGLSLRVPIAIIGDTGCGKTEAVRQFHKDLKSQLAKQKIDLKLYTMILSMVPPEDIGGIPTFDKETQRIHHRMMACLPFDDDEWAIIFQDELDRASPETQNAALQFQLGGEYHGHKLSPNAYTVSAMNGTADIYTNTLSQAAVTRMCTIFMSRKAKDGGKSYDNWARKNGIPQVCRTFNEQFSSLIKCTQDYEELAVCTNRTIDMCGLVTLAKQQVDAMELFETDDIYYPMISGLIGSEAAANYLAIEKSLRDQLDPYEVINSPEDAELMSDPSMIFYLIQAVCGIIRSKYDGDKKKIRAIAAYGMRHKNDEWKEIWMSSILKEFPEFATDIAYTRWVGAKKSRGLGIM